MKYALVFMFVFGCSACASLPQIESEVNLSQQPHADINIESVEVKSTFFNFTKIIRMRGYINVTQPGWRVKGFQVIYGQSKGHTIDVQNFKKKIQSYHEADLENQREAEQSVTDPGQILTHEIKIVFERSAKHNQTGKQPIEFEFETGVPWGHNFCVFDIGKQRFFEYWFRTK